jgi:hypothetical protein
MQKVLIRCPKCFWEPDNTCRWQCSDCKKVWDTFTTHGKCPGCGRVYETTSCLRKRGGCGEASPHSDWYEEVKTEKKKGLFGFWKTKAILTVTPGDKKWTEDSLLALADLLTPEVFKSFSTLTSADFEVQPKLTEDDAEHILQKMISIMNIDGWEIRLMYFSSRSVKYTEGIVETPSEKLKGSWSSSTGKYVDNGLGNKEIWIEERQLDDLQSFVSTLAYELAGFKLMNEYGAEEKDPLLASLTAVGYGFGIFMGNSYFNFSQWTGSSHQGWSMRKTGYLPEQVIAYAMAWLAYYRNEDIAWTSAFNKTMKKYFDQCYKYISENKEKVRWV